MIDNLRESHENPAQRAFREDLLESIQAHFNGTETDFKFLLPLSTLDEHWRSFVPDGIEIRSARLAMRKIEHQPSRRSRLESLLFKETPNPRYKVELSLFVPNGKFEISIFPDRPNPKVFIDRYSLENQTEDKSRQVTEEEYRLFQKLVSNSSTFPFAN